MIIFFLVLALTGLCAARQIRKWRDEDNMAEVERILEAWAVIERRKRSSTTGRFRRTYGHFSAPHDLYHDKH